MMLSFFAHNMLYKQAKPVFYRVTSNTLKVDTSKMVLDMTC